VGEWAAATARIGPRRRSGPHARARKEGGVGEQVAVVARIGPRRRSRPQARARKEGGGVGEQAAAATRIWPRRRSGPQAHTRKEEWKGRGGGADRGDSRGMESPFHPPRTNIARRCASVA
jgi:hypothetical protein